MLYKQVIWLIKLVMWLKVHVGLFSWVITEWIGWKFFQTHLVKYSILIIMEWDPIKSWRKEKHLAQELTFWLYWCTKLANRIKFGLIPDQDQLVEKCTAEEWKDGRCLCFQKGQTKILGVLFLFFYFLGCEEWKTNLPSKKACLLPCANIHIQICQGIDNCFWTWIGLFIYWVKDLNMIKIWLLYWTPDFDI